MNCHRVLAELAHLKEHMVKHFGNVQTSKMWEALAPEKAQTHWLNGGMCVRCCEHIAVLKLLWSVPSRCVGG